MFSGRPGSSRASPVTCGSWMDSASSTRGNEWPGSNTPSLFPSVLRFVVPAHPSPIAINICEIRQEISNLVPFVKGVGSRDTNSRWYPSRQPSLHCDQILPSFTPYGLRR
ncbi:hypothetical protein LshimejAT787_1600820 [Lyophyllum shimeji]|uniref:Uncharacterized protein n=1 Tax=Lyophyllum shimeji TaxID=47721 RepID=A0A9P3PWA1_LYOSH|nr:hypothetical protein LshimejAT787_1600820 [Lyophyllum shimeji]